MEASMRMEKVPAYSVTRFVYLQPSRRFARPQKLSSVFLTARQNVYIYIFLIKSTGLPKEKGIIIICRVLQLIVSTWRVRISHNGIIPIDHTHLMALVLAIYQQIKMHSLFFDMFVYKVKPQRKRILLKTFIAPKPMPLYLTRTRCKFLPIWTSNFTHME